jgi:Na+/proline symporter
MKPYEFFELICQWIGMVSLVIGASTFWGAVVAGIAKVSFDMGPGRALLLVGLPVALLVAAFLIPRIKSIMGYA